MVTEQTNLALRVLMDQVVAATGNADWPRVRTLTNAILSLDPNHHEAVVFQRTAESILGAPIASRAATQPDRPRAKAVRHRHSHELDDVVKLVSQSSCHFRRSRRASYKCSTTT